MDGTFSDIRFALRLFRRTPIFSLVAIVTLALGIGANTAIFSAVHAALLRPLPFDDPEKVVMVWEDASHISFPRNTPAPANYFDWKRLNQVFTEMAATRGQSANLTTEGPPEQVLGRGVTASFFAVLGVRPPLGRPFTEAEDTSGAPVVVISHGLWQRRYGGDPTIIGKPIVMSGVTRTVIGVMPREFAFRNRDIDFWMPAHFTPEEVANRNSHYLNVVARLAPKATIAAARADMTRVAKQLAVDHPDSNGRIGAVVVPMREDSVGNVQLELLVLLAAAGCVLLIACANLASLLLARAVNRRGELGIRASLGASRGRIVRQMIIEGVLLASVGGVAGLFLAPAGTILIVRLIPSAIQTVDKPIVNVPVLAFAALLSVATGVLFSLVPAFEAARGSLAARLHESGRSGLVRHGRFGNAMVIVQVALAIGLLATTGLFLRTLANLRSIDLGFRSAGVLTLRTTLPREKYGDKTRRAAFYDRVVADVRGLPGVQNAAYASTLPFQSIGNTNSYRFEAGASVAGEPTDALFRVATNEYLQTLGVQLVTGRLIDDRDGRNSPGVVVVNETLARRHWPAESPLGHRLTFTRPGVEGPWFTIVGVVKDVRERGYQREMKPGVYLPFAQVPDTWAVPETLVVRVDGDPLTIAASVRRIISSVDPEQPIAAVRTLAEVVDLDVADRTEQVTLLTAFAGLAVLLASTGLYGLLAYSVTARRREIGVRMALGAQARTIVRAIITRGLSLTAAGIGVGLAAAGMAAQAMRGLLYGVDALDPKTLATAAGLFGVVALTASAMPAIRAARVDPMQALREE